MRFMFVLAIGCGLLTAVPRPTPAAASRQAVFVNLADSLQGSFEDASASLRSALLARGWEVLAMHDVAVPTGGCPYRARIAVVNAPTHTEAVLAYGPRAAFAIPVRLALYEDELGLHLTAVNPCSIDRTIGSETGLASASGALLDGLEDAARGALRGRFERRPYGQVRDRGLIGRTMGLMAGGPFLGKLHELRVTEGNASSDLTRLADQVERGIRDGGGRGRWQIREVYRFDRPDKGFVLIGVSGAALEAKSFAIVGAGSDGRRSGFRCAGLAHSAAYPIEIVVFRDEGRLHVCTIDGMYRMKMYFEDAGKMKFAANMAMPGSVEDEIRALALAGFEAKPVAGSASR